MKEKDKAVTPSPPAGAWLKDLLLQLVDRAAFDVDDLKAHPEEALHRLRLRMKKAEALLRLSRGAVRKQARKMLREQMKEVKNVGGPQRDALVLGKLAKKLGRPKGLCLELPEVPALKIPIRKLRGLVEKLRQALADESFDSLDWEDLQENYAACYRAGRRRMRKAEASGAPEAFHRWRKRVKALHYQSQALHRGLEKRKHRLQDTRRLAKLLGREQDLSLLEEEIGAQFRDNAWMPVITATREQLHPQILKLAGELFDPSAHQFAELPGIFEEGHGK